MNFKEKLCRLSLSQFLNMKDEFNIHYFKKNVCNILILKKYRIFLFQLRVLFFFFMFELYIRYVSIFKILRAISNMVIGKWTIYINFHYKN